MDAEIKLEDGLVLTLDENGNVYRNGVELKQSQYNTGYLYVNVSGKNYLVHRLVASAFIEPLKKGDRSRQVHHKDGDKKNNKLSNLSVISMKEHQHIHKQIYPLTKVCIVCGEIYTPNKTKRKRQLTCSKECWRKRMRETSVSRMKKIDQYSIDGELLKTWECARDAQRSLGFYESNINKCCNNKIKSYKGYIWKYHD